MQITVSALRHNNMVVLRAEAHGCVPLRSLSQSAAKPCEHAPISTL